MVRVSELPIYDRPDWKRPVPKPTPVTNIELVVTSTLNEKGSNKNNAET